MPVEPPVGDRRLRPVRALLVSIALCWVIVVPVLGISAQESDSVSLAARAGLGGFVDARRPVELAVTIEAEVLFAGTLEVRQGNSLLELPVEVPASGEKVYTVRLAPPVGTVQTRLRLLPAGSEEPVATTSLQLRAPIDQTVVGVAGPGELLAVVDAATVGVTGSEVVAVEIDDGILARGPYPARYLILDPARPLPDATREWVRAGGRLIAPLDGLDRLGIELGEAVRDGEDAVYRVGSGLVTGLPRLAALGSAEWSRLITPTRVDLAPRDVWQSPELQLMQAATSAGDQRIPAIPWLLAAVVGYAVVVGPVNFLLLRKLGRRELAWITVPVLSALAVTGFWILGRQRLQTTLVNHATVIVAGRSGSPARTAIAVAAGTGGQKSVALPPEWLSYPGSISPELAGGFPQAPVSATTDGNGEFRFRLEQLGAAGVQAAWEAGAVGAPDLAVARDGARLVVDVVNDTSFEFWAWGVVARGRAAVASGPLAAGGEDRATVVPGQSGMNEFGTVGDAVIQARQLWNDPFIWNKLSPLGYTATSLLGDGESYFFGFTDQVTVAAEVDGEAVAVGGSTLIVVPIDLMLLPDAGAAATSHLVDTGNASWVDFGPGYLSVSSEEMTVAWSLPDPPPGDPRLEVSNLFGQLPGRLDAYNWTSGSYDEVESGASLDLNQYLSDLGEVIVRARAVDDDDPQDFLEIPMTPFAFTLEWGS